MGSRPFNQKHLVFVISGPSGCGKSTIAKKLCNADETLRLSISATTREARPNEVDGVNYHFFSHDKFEELIEQNAFLEYAQYRENYYGTLKSEINTAREQGQDTILEIEVNGALQVQSQNLTQARSILIFMIPTSYAILENRLRSRNTESEEELKNRLKIAETELQQITHYDYCVINPEKKIKRAINDIQAIIAAERSRVNPEETSTFIQSFGIPNRSDLDS